MAGHRSSRLNEQFKREISDILARKVRDPRVGPVLVTEVRVTADLWVAKVYFRVLDAERDRKEVTAGLEAAAPFVRRELGRILSIRRIPELRFQYDTTLDSAIRIEEVLRDVLPEHDADPGGEGDGGLGGDEDQEAPGPESRA